MPNNEIIYPDKWGPHVWQALHYITLGYPENPSDDQKLKYQTFFTLLKDTLPCSVCAQHYGDNLQRMPLSDQALADKESLVKWLIDCHNVVNEMKEKPIIEYIKARKMIDTDKPCKQPIKYVEKIINNCNKPNKYKKYVENFTENDKQIKQQVTKEYDNQTNICSSNNAMVYTLIGLLISLIFIAIVYKKL